MRYKQVTIKEDVEMDKQLEIANRAEVARRVGVSRTYLSAAYKGKVIITEELYNKIKKVLAI